MERSIKDYLIISLKGMAMGAADVVPGVSGGTIAFITGIYEELIDTISRIDLSLVGTWKKEGFKAVWTQVNGSFILALFSGIGVSIVSLARLITYLMEVHPIPLWSFFFGLIIASVVFIGKQIGKWSVTTVLALILGAAIAYVVTIMTPSDGSVSLPYVFLTGSVAICAMILPGISGSFIALLMGSYKTIFGAIGDLTSDPLGNLPIVMSFALGALIGILSFSRLLKYLFKNFRAVTLAVLTGFMIGSLNKVWPWKQVMEYRTDSSGEQVPFLERSISPGVFESVMGIDPQIPMAIAMSLAGIAIVWAMAKLAPKE